MLDLKLLRDERDAVVAGLSKRMEAEEAAAAVDAVITLDAERRELIQTVDGLRSKQKEAGRLIGQLKREGKDIPPDMDPGALKQQIQEGTQRQREVDDELEALLAEIPNLPADDVVAGGKEANVVVSTWGTKPERADDAPDHVDIATDLGLVDFERGTKLAGSGAWIYRGMGARIEWALINFFIQRHLDAGYEFMLPPHLLLESAGFAAGQFPKFRDDVFHIQVPDGDRGKFLLPTAETAILGTFADELLRAEDLPLKVFAYTPCYRNESAGSHSDERGTVRGQQFNKVEIFHFTTDEDPLGALDEMIAHAEGIVRDLGLHYQVSKLAAQDASASMRKTFDIEVWMPSMGIYKEVSSVSWAGEYQARRAKIRYRAEGEKSSTFIHTLNGSALATSRLLPAILEHNLQPDGSVVVPEVLRQAIGAEVLHPSS